MDLFSNDYQMALGDNEQGLVAASQGSWQQSLPSRPASAPKSGAAGERAASILSYGRCPSCRSGTVCSQQHRQSLLTPREQASKEPSQIKAFVK